MNTNSLSELMLALRRRITENAKRSGLKHELTLSQLEALWFIQSAGKSTMERLANHLGIKAPSVTAIIDKLEKSRYVSRTRDQKDRRVTYLALTAKTARQLVLLKKQKDRFFAQLLATLSAKDRKEFERILALLLTKTI